MAAALSLVWIIGITSAFNIIDIMDGLSSSVAFIASIAFLLIALPTEKIYVNFCAVALAGGCLGFIPYNLSRGKKIFMGDTGSLTIGFILAAMSMGTSYTTLNDVGLMAPLLILAIPIYDTILVMYLRWRKGQSPFLGSRDHFALRLETMGFSRRQILAITYTASIVLAFGAFLITRLPLLWATALFAVILAGALGISYRLSLVDMEPTPERCTPAEPSL
jgi:UDP-GlcNAc:undecaprenyl-phosphate GlcNAc-1-phosphate transferase